MINKSKLAIELSKLEVFGKAQFKLEQHPTDSEIAAKALWDAYMNGDIKDKIIGDLGCGTGILGIGALLLGAKEVIFVEKEEEAIKCLKKNLETYELSNYLILCKEIKDFNREVDIIIQNPPFGTKEKHADREFLLKAFSLADTVYTFHKTSTTDFIKRISKEYEFKVVNVTDFKFPLKNTMSHHKSRIKRIDVSLFLLKQTKEI